MVSTIKVPFGSVKQVPDPTKVVTTWEWYFLDQVSSSLIKWNAQLNAFEGVLAENWSYNENAITFNLRKNLMFSNGEPLTAVDVAASVKRALLKKSSSHFRPWELLDGCNGLKSINDACPGIVVSSPTSITFFLKFPSESFFLFMACPEGSIWSERDLLMEEFAPKTFSGAYAVKERTEGAHILESNPNWAFTNKFLDRPKQIIASWSADSELRENISKGHYDLILDLERPFGNTEIPEALYKIKGAAFNTLYYLFKVTGSKATFGRKCLERLWEKKFPSSLVPASSYLPFEGLSGIERKDILDSLPPGDCGRVRVGYLKGYFSEEFIDFLFDRSLHELVPLDSGTYFDSFTKSYSKDNLDFVLSPYVASERYPSVQISFLMEDREIPFDLSVLDHRDQIQEKKQLLNKIQKWTVSTQQIIPLVFGRSQLAYKPGIRVGNQPLIDSELQLWRVNE